MTDDNKAELQEWAPAKPSKNYSGRSMPRRGKLELIQASNPHAMQE